MTWLWWDPLPVVPQVARIEQGGGGPVDLVYGLGRVYAVDGAGSAAVFATDHLGSVVATSATAGLVLAEEYTPFGQPHAPPPGPGAVGFGYRGELHVGDLLHLRARDYQPATGVFLAPDPLDGVPGLPTVTNRYHYANNDPLGFVDPLGLRPWNDQDMRGGLFTDADGHNIIRCGLTTFSEAIGHFFTAGLLYRDRTCDNPIYDPSRTSGHYTSEAIGAAGIANVLATTYAAGAVTTQLSVGRGAGITASAIDDASRAAFQAADDIAEFTEAKHLTDSGGGWSQFARGVDPLRVVQEALRSSRAQFLPNPQQPDTFRVVTDLSRVIGTRGESVVRVIVSAKGRVLNAFPVKVK